MIAHILTIACTLAMACWLVAIAYVGMSRDLCRRDLTAAEYHEMRLDCGVWPYNTRGGK